MSETLAESFGDYLHTYPSRETANSDGSFGVADLVTLQKWLLGASDVKISDWKTVDICKDDSIDSFDLVKMRKRLVENNSLEPEKYEINAKYIRTGGNYEHLAGN